MDHEKTEETGNLASVQTFAISFDERFVLIGLVKEAHSNYTGALLADFLPLFTTFFKPGLYGRLWRE